VTVSEVSVRHPPERRGDTVAAVKAGFASVSRAAGRAGAIARAEALRLRVRQFQVQVGGAGWGSSAAECQEWWGRGVHGGCTGY